MSRLIHVCKRNRCTDNWANRSGKTYAEERHFSDHLYRKVLLFRKCDQYIHTNIPMGGIVGRWTEILTNKHFCDLNTFKSSQHARVCRQSYAFVVCMQQSQGFSQRCPYDDPHMSWCIIHKTLMITYRPVILIVIYLRVVI